MPANIEQYRSIFIVLFIGYSVYGVPALLWQAFKQRKAAISRRDGIVYGWLEPIFMLIVLLSLTTAVCINIGWLFLTTSGVVAVLLVLKWMYANGYDFSGRQGRR